jgi:hypothetical protein
MFRAATRTARLKTGADISAEQSRPRRAEIFAPPDPGFHSPLRPLAPPLLFALDIAENSSQTRRLIWRSRVFLTTPSSMSRK